MSGFMCNLCNVHLNSHSQFLAHQIGKKHLQKLKPGDEIPTPVVDPSKRLYGTFVRAAAETVGTGNVKENVTQQVPGLDLPPPPPSQKPESPPPPPPPPSQKPESPPPPPPPPPPEQNESLLLFSAKGTSGLQTTNTSYPLNTPVNQAVMDNALGKLPTKRKIYTGHCEICKLDFNSESQSQAHFIGSKHAKKMKHMVMLKTGEQMCEYCGVPYNSDSQKSQHLSSENHRKKLALLKLPVTTTSYGNPVSTVNTQTLQVGTVNTLTVDSGTGNTAVNKPAVNSGSAPVTTSSKDEDFGSCEYCAVQYRSASNKYLHLNGKKHKRNVALTKGVLPDSVNSKTDNSVRKQTFFTCQFCGVMLNSLQQLEAHRQGQKHKDNVNKHKLQGKKVDESQVTTI